MAQNTRIVVRVDAQTKANAEKILRRTGIKMSEAMRIFLQKIIIMNGVPFEIRTRRRDFDEVLKLPPKEMYKYMNSLTKED
jgi:addiction module RelB/DinJ family antitoxin